MREGGEELVFEHAGFLGPHAQRLLARELIGALLLEAPPLRDVTCEHIDPLAPAVGHEVVGRLHRHGAAVAPAVAAVGVAAA